MLAIKVHEALDTNGKSSSKPEEVYNNTRIPLSFKICNRAPAHASERIWSNRRIARYLNA